MIIVTLLLLTGGGQTMSTPTFTDAQVTEVETCVDRGDNQGACSGVGSQAAIACMTDLPGDATEDAFGNCMSGIMDRCVSSWAATTAEMNERVIRICSARLRGATQAAVADWFVRAENRLPSPVYEGYRRTYGTVAKRADDQASAATALPDLSLPLRVTAIRTGVWDSFARFLWHAERDEN